MSKILLALLTEAKRLRVCVYLIGGERFRMLQLEKTRTKFGASNTAGLFSFL